MKKMKKVAGMSLAMVMGVTSAAGCGTSAVKMPEEPSEIAKLATERTNALKSYELSGTAKIDVEAMGESVAADVTLNAVYFKDPMKMKMDMNVVYGEENMDMSMYMMKEEDSYVMYMGTTVEGTESWMKQTIDSSDEANAALFKQLEGAENNEMVEKYADLYTLSEEKAADGETALDFTLTADTLTSIVSEMGMEEQLTEAGASTEMFAMLGDIKAQMTVDNKNVYWKSIKMDLAQNIQGLLDTIMAAYGDAAGDTTMAVNACSIEMTYSKYDEATDFELPEAAKDAVDMSDMTGALLGEDAAAEDATTEDATAETEEAAE